MTDDAAGDMPGRCCSPLYNVPLSSRNECSKCVVADVAGDIVVCQNLITGQQPSGVLAGEGDGAGAWGCTRRSSLEGPWGLPPVNGSGGGDGGGGSGRGLHSSTFQLNLSALYGIGGARSCVGRVKGVLGVVEGV